MATATALTRNNPIECNELLDRCLGNSMLVQRVLKKFVDQVGTDIDLLVSAIVGQDVTESIRLAHKVRGTSLSVSALEMSKIAHDIELLAETANEADLLTLTVNLAKERDRVFDFLDTFCIATKDA